MPFVAITSGQIAAGEPTAQDLFTKIKDNLDDHETRITTVETASNLYRPIQFDIVGPYGEGLIGDGVLYDLLRFDITVLNVFILLNKAGVSGTTTIDLEYKRGVGAFTSILTSPINAGFALGDFGIATGTLSVTSLLANDILRLNVDSAQFQATGFQVFLEYEVA